MHKKSNRVYGIAPNGQVIFGENRKELVQKALDIRDKDFVHTQNVSSSDSYRLHNFITK